jgi:hypothetical protein
MLTNTYICMNRDFKEIVPEGGNIGRVIYRGPTVIQKTDKGKHWSWSYFVALDKGDITDEHLDNKRLTDVCKFHTIYGEIGSKGYPKVTIGKAILPSNVGKKNETNQVLRAISTGESELKSRAKKGYTPLNQLNRVIGWADIDEDINRAPIPEKFKPKGVPTFPLFAAIKYDGVSLLFVYHPDLKAQYLNILAFTRNRKVCAGFEDIKEQLLPHLKEHPGLVVVGEFYKHGIPRNQLNSIHSHNLHGSVLIGDCDYYMFDCFYPIQTKVEIGEIDVLLNAYNDALKEDNPNFILRAGQDLEGMVEYLQQDISSYKFEARQEYLKAIFGKVGETFTYAKKSSEEDEIVPNLLKLATYYEISNQDDLDCFYSETLANGYEGLVVRKNTLYLCSFKSPKMNATSFKMKPIEEDEYEVIGFKHGDGKAAKNVIFECLAPEAKGDRASFSVPMNIDDEEMKLIFDKSIEDPTYYIGMMLTVRYERLSEYGVPQFPKGITFRED